MFKRDTALVSLTLSLLINGLAAKESMQQFSYDHKTEIAYSYQSADGYKNVPGFRLLPEIDAFACHVNQHLNQSILFDRSLLIDVKKTREYHTKQKPVQGNVGVLYDVTTQDGLTLGCTFFDRGSDTLLVVGSGFTNEREMMSPFIDMFPEYDVLLFDFRGHGYTPGIMCSTVDIDKPACNLAKGGFGIDSSVVGFGKYEHEDVISVISSFKNLRQDRSYKQPLRYAPYRQVFGLGVCYSAFIFLKTAAQYPGLFDKLVLDGCWLSLPLFVAKAKKDLLTLVNPQTGGWSDHWFFGHPWVQEAAEWIARNIIQLQLTDITLMDYAPKITDTPLLFFYGKNDYMVTREEFEQLWDNLPTKEKMVVITSNPHVRNHLKQKELYKLICDLFFQLPQAHVIQCLSNPADLVAHYKSKLDRFVPTGPQ